MDDRLIFPLELSCLDVNVVENDVSGFFLRKMFVSEYPLFRIIYQDLRNKDCFEYITDSWIELRMGVTGGCVILVSGFFNNVTL